jgi:hypothetical protein
VDHRIANVFTDTECLEPEIELCVSISCVSIRAFGSSWNMTAHNTIEQAASIFQWMGEAMAEAFLYP